jgi:DNA-binding MarR family transcriptional regulator
MSELSDRMNLNTSTMTRVLDNLVRDNYISRDRDQEDRRIVVINLTVRGREAAETLNASVNSYYRKIVENIPSGEINRILESVGMLINAFEKANPNCC